MKIFISHSSANKYYGEALVELLRGVGLKEDEIIFTSNVAYGIPIAQNIFKWLKSQISEKPFVIYLLSKEYYSSVACLNEMGAAWIIENEHAVIFTPDFDIDSRDFRNGALDSREIGFRINDEERVLSFIQNLETWFSITKKSVIINQKLKIFISQINSFSSNTQLLAKQRVLTEDKRYEPLADNNTSNKVNANESPEQQDSIYLKFINDIIAGKLSDAEIILLQYIIETGRSKLMTGWQEDHEISHLKEWEEIHDLKEIASANYTKAISKFSLRKYTLVSAVTSSGNPKEVKLQPEIESNILELPDEVTKVINNTVFEHKGRTVKNTPEDWF